MTQQREHVEPKRLSWDELSDATEEEIEAHNEAVEQHLDAKLEKMDASKREAINLLRKQAADTAETTTVNLDTMQEPLEVRTRIPSDVEDLYEQLQHATEEKNIRQVRNLSCRMLAAMVVGPEGFDDPTVWRIASRDRDAGISWLMESTDKILEPAIEKAREMEGNAKP